MLILTLVDAAWLVEEEIYYLLFLKSQKNKLEEMIPRERREDNDTFYCGDHSCSIWTYRSWLMHWLVSGVVGFFIGGWVGTFAMALCAASGAASRAEEKYNVLSN